LIGKVPESVLFLILMYSSRRLCSFSIVKPIFYVTSGSNVDAIAILVARVLLPSLRVTHYSSEGSVDKHGYIYIINTNVELLTYVKALLKRFNIESTGPKLCIRQESAKPLRKAATHLSQCST
jgi:hypothetical protein